MASILTCCLCKMHSVSVFQFVSLVHCPQRVIYLQRTGSCAVAVIVATHIIIRIKIFFILFCFKIVISGADGEWIVVERVGFVDVLHFFEDFYFLFEQADNPLFVVELLAE